MTKEDLQATIYASTRRHGQSRVIDVRALRAYQIARKLRVPLDLIETEIRILRHTFNIMSRYVDPSTATLSDLEKVAFYLDGPRPKPNHEVAERLSLFIFGCPRSKLTVDQKQALTRAWWAYLRKQGAA